MSYKTYEIDPDHIPIVVEELKEICKKHHVITASDLELHKIGEDCFIKAKVLLKLKEI